MVTIGLHNLTLKLSLQYLFFNQCILLQVGGGRDRDWLGVGVAEGAVKVSWTLGGGTATTLTSEGLCNTGIEYILRIAILRTFLIGPLNEQALAHAFYRLIYHTAV